jgi:hypothetical protein
MNATNLSVRSSCANADPYYHLLLLRTEGCKLQELAQDVCWQSGPVYTEVGFLLVPRVLWFW